MKKRQKRSEDALVLRGVCEGGGGLRQGDFQELAVDTSGSFKALGFRVAGLSVRSLGVPSEGFR